MTSSRPYLIRAFYEWIMDNDFTPYIVIEADYPDVTIPTQYVENGRIVLNIAPTAIRDLLITNDHLEFNARFGGVPFSVYAPIKGVEAIYAKENGRGMVFKEEEDDDDETPPPSGSSDKKDKEGDKKDKGKKSDRSHLTVIK